MNTRSQPSLTSASEAADFNLLRMLFLATAFPSRLLTEKPNRVAWERLRLAISTSLRSDQLLPSRLAVTKSAVFLRRRSLGMDIGFCLWRACPSWRLSFGMERLRNSRARRSDSQLVSAFEHPPLDDVAARFRPHSGPESMNSGAAPLSWLVCSLGHLKRNLSYREL